MYTEDVLMYNMHIYSISTNIQHRSKFDLQEVYNTPDSNDHLII